jgi:hypothetical protein
MRKRQILRNNQEKVWRNLSLNFTKKGCAPRKIDELFSNRLRHPQLTIKKTAHKGLSTTKIKLISRQLVL